MENEYLRSQIFKILLHCLHAYTVFYKKYSDNDFVRCEIKKSLFFKTSMMISKETIE